MKLRTITVALLGLATACSSPRAAPQVVMQPSVVVAAAAPTAPPPRSPERFAELLAAYDAAPEADRVALEPELDRAAGQRYAAHARLYWHTDLAAAQAVAKATGRPILSLRMLGRLDEDLSCANSRMFRTLLYPDPAVSQLLRDRFVLHWSSERPVPRVTVDFGDGRRLETTVTGNSAHYVLDADGAPLDVLPGMYAPAVFRAALERAADLADHLRGADVEARTRELRDYHAEAVRRVEQLWNRSRVVRTTDLTSFNPRAAQLELAQMITVTKAAVEVPTIRRLDLGVDPGVLITDNSGRAAVARAAWKLEPAQVLAEPVTARVRGFLAPGPRGDAALARLTTGILAETALDELALHRQINAYFVAQLARGPMTFEATNAYVYAELFRTPASDPWLGLLPDDVYTGLPGGAVVIDPGT